MELEVYKAPNKDVSLLIGFFAESLRKIKSITIGFKAIRGFFDYLSFQDTVLKGGGQVDSGIHALYSAIRPSLDEYQDLFSRLPEGFPLTFIGHRDGGAVATLAAAELAEKFPKINVTLMTINSELRWNYEFTQRVDRVVSNVHRWRDGVIIYGSQASLEDTNEVWFVPNQLHCCPRPESAQCLRQRGVLINGILSKQMTFQGREVFGDDFCDKFM
jgi:hypothetical protein